MSKTAFKVDLSHPPEQAEVKTHNRWHPDIPMVEMFRPGNEFRVECFDWTGGQIEDNDSANDVRDVDLTKVHYLSGPFGVEGAEPGDLLVVDLLDLGALNNSQWGFTGIFARENGGGFLVDHYPHARKAIWDFHGIYCTSRHVPSVRWAGIIHPGLIGCLPNRELLERCNKREAELIGTNPDRVPPLAVPPYPETALMGKLTGKHAQQAAKEAWRTVPPREHGGNCDIKNLSRGSRVFFPVYVKNAGLSMGDIHWSQGDGEITFCGAIEMAGFVDIGVASPVEPHFSQYVVFEGISVDEKTGKQHYLDAHVAYRRASLNAIEYLKKFGYTGEQAYILLGTAPVEGRISGIVDIPNACCTLAIPTDIFDFDIRPNAAGPTRSVPAGVDVSKAS